MKVYLSTTSSNLPKARALMQRIRRAGHTITYDWTKGFERERQMGLLELGDRAEADIEGVRSADIVIVYMQPKMADKMTGAAVEIGAALALGKPLAIIEEEATFGHFFRNHRDIALISSMDEVLAQMKRQEGR